MNAAIVRSPEHRFPILFPANNNLGSEKKVSGPPDVNLGGMGVVQNTLGHAIPQNFPQPQYNLPFRPMMTQSPLSFSMPPRAPPYPVSSSPATAGAMNSISSSRERQYQDDAQEDSSRG
ncbi:hypothetical protein HD806DRAFT_547018 [Xylariaceae sp. AK1471]|nr:hypothetical protein HD806DRAFT_547018 [Xylariaceae sp. AK1471]